MTTAGPDETQLLSYQRLVDELQLCQMAFDAISARSWQSTGILLAGAMATLALMLQVQATELSTAAITTLFAIGALTILAVWSAFIQRETLLQKKLIERMSELELVLEFQRERRLHGASDMGVSGLSPVGALAKGFLSSIDQSGIFAWTSRLVAVGWIAVVVWRWVIWAT